MTDREGLTGRRMILAARARALRREEDPGALPAASRDEVTGCGGLIHLHRARGRALPHRGGIASAQGLPRCVALPESAEAVACAPRRISGWRQLVSLFATGAQVAKREHEFERCASLRRTLPARALALIKECTVSAHDPCVRACHYVRVRAVFRRAAVSDSIRCCVGCSDAPPRRRRRGSSPRRRAVAPSSRLRLGPSGHRPLTVTMTLSRTRWLRTACVKRFGSAAWDTSARGRAGGRERLESLRGEGSREGGPAVLGCSMCACACVCVCVRARARVCVCVCV
jgi:hypothetical protein